MKRAFLLLFPRGPETLPAARFFFCSGPTGVPVFFLPAGLFPVLGPLRPSAPFPLPDSPPGGPRLSGASSSPTEPDSGSSPTRPRARRRVPLGPARPGPCSAPIKGTLDPLEIPNRSRSRRFRKNLARAAAIVGAWSSKSRRRSFASRRLFLRAEASRRGEGALQLRFSSPSRSVRSL